MKGDRLLGRDRYWRQVKRSADGFRCFHAFALAWQTRDWAAAVLRAARRA